MRKGKGTNQAYPKECTAIMACMGGTAEEGAAHLINGEQKTMRIDRKKITHLQKITG